MAYDRPWKSFEEQLELLRSRGLQVADEQAALRCLERIGYYRLSAYWYPFRVFTISQGADSALTSTRTDEFVRNTHFADAYDLYLFDKKLRLLVLDAMERIEIALRVDAAYVLGRSGAFAHLDASALHPVAQKVNNRTGRTRHEEWRSRYESLLMRSKEDFVQHYRERHGPDLPVWVAVEVMDFGSVSQLLSMMKVADLRQIANKYGIPDTRVLTGWLRSLNYLRNLAAHHSRTWNRNVIDQPVLPSKGELAWCDAFIGQPGLVAKPFLLLAIARHMLRALFPETHWAERVADHVNRFPQQQSSRALSLADMGVPHEWESWWTGK